ncbi:MAG: signal recognition particle protein [Negativicutes bacterium]
MLFSGLADRLQGIFKNLRGRGRLSESDVNECLREIRLALLEADVNFKVVKDFVARVKVRAVGQDVLESLNPAQQVVKIVYDELTEMMGGVQRGISMASEPPTVIMMVGLQGSGKTTTAAKLARHFAKQGKRPLLVAADLYRPAAVQQLQTLGKQIDIPVLALAGEKSPLAVVKSVRETALAQLRDIVIIDTAGRLHVDTDMMDELVNIKKLVNPHEVLLVVDAMTGQDAVNVAENFHDLVGIDGIILTKMDGDARGGAALSVRAVTGRPIKFVGSGEKTENLESFHPDRMASRILGMGDMLSLIEKAQETFDKDKAVAMQQKLSKNEFTLDDFLTQMQSIRKMGSFEQILGMIPGLGSKMKQLQGMEIDEKDMKRVEAIIQSMTKRERRDPTIINGSRRKRIADGSGTRVQDVNRLLKQFLEARKMMKRMQGMQKPGQKMSGFRLPFGH